MPAMQTAENLVRLRAQNGLLRTKQRRFWHRGHTQHTPTPAQPIPLLPRRACYSIRRLPSPMASEGRLEVNLGSFRDSFKAGSGRPYEAASRWIRVVAGSPQARCGVVSGSFQGVPGSMRVRSGTERLMSTHKSRLCASNCEAASLKTSADHQRNDRPRRWTLYAPAHIRPPPRRTTRVPPALGESAAKWHAG